MGLSSLPSPSEGFLTVLIINAVLYVSILKQLFRSILRLLGRRVPAPEDHAGIVVAAAEPSLIEIFRSRSKPFRFGSTGGRKRLVDCRVCLGRFEPDTVVNRLPCGHLFHKGCLETWLEYRHATCPLCRSHVLCVVEPSAASTSAASTNSWLWFR